MLVLILINYQYSQNVIFSFEKSSNGQNYSPSDSHPSDKKVLTQQNFSFSLLMLYGKPCQPSPPPSSDSYSPNEKILLQQNFPFSLSMLCGKPHVRCVITHSAKETRQQKQELRWRLTKI